MAAYTRSYAGLESPWPSRQCVGTPPTNVMGVMARRSPSSCSEEAGVPGWPTNPMPQIESTCLPPCCRKAGDAVTRSSCVRWRQSRRMSDAHVASCAPEMSYITESTRPLASAARSAWSRMPSFLSRSGPGLMPLTKRWTKTPSSPYSRIQRKCTSAVLFGYELKSFSACPFSPAAREVSSGVGWQDLGGSSSVHGQRSNVELVALGPPLPLQCTQPSFGAPDDGVSNHPW